jgi:hypothetical protein
MRHERVKIVRDTNTVHNKTVAPWEIPVIEFLFDDGNVQRQDGEDDQFVNAGDTEYPDAASEMTRLILAYGEDRKSGVPFAVSVYGAGARGVKNLAKAIEEAQRAEQKAARSKKPAAKQATKVKPRSVAPRVREESDAALMS